MTDQTSTKVITGRVRGSYVNVFEPRVSQLSGKSEYSITLLIPKSDTATVKAIRDACEAAANAKWGSKRPPRVDSPLRDGDGERPSGGMYPPECAKHFVLNAKTTQRPGVVDKQLRDVIDTLEFVSGDYCRASLNFFAYDTSGNKGVAAGLNNIQVLEKGDPLSSRARAADDFRSADTSDDVPW